MAKYRENVTDKQFGKLIVLGDADSYIEPSGRQRRIVTAKCDCGDVKNYRLEDLRSGATQSCGCLRNEQIIKANTTHGHASNGLISTEYRIWRGMKVRCENERSKYFNNYGARGVSIHDRWKDSFEQFYQDMGPRPSKDHSLDRIDNNGNYEPSNCKWSTKKEQNNNKRNNTLVEYNGKIQTVAQWASEYNLNYNTLFYRLARGCTPEEALTNPVINKV